MLLKPILTKIVKKQDLNLAESKFIAQKIIKGQLTPAQTGAVLTALRMKGESIDEILGFVAVTRQSMTRIPARGKIIDTCGTGGDNSQTFNISTAVALVVAGAGVKVAKHGNRNISSLCGSADALEALGVNVNLTPKQANTVLSETGITFLFAPIYHPLMKNVAPIRKELSLRTIFNFLGPLVSPASVKYQLLGVPDLKTAKLLAQTAVKLNYQHLLIVHSQDGLDEISISAPTHLFDIRQKKLTTKVIKPNDFDFKPASKNSLKGGNAQKNTLIIKQILNGKKGPKTNIVILNSAAALYVAGKATSIFKGIKLAKNSINQGHAKSILDKFIKQSQKYVKHS